MYILLLVLIDQLTKICAKEVLQNTDGISVIKNIINFTYVENRGAAFGMMNGKQLFLIILTSFILGYMIYYYIRYVKSSKDKLIKLSLSLFIAGAIGNLIDRIFRGYVIDFLDLKFIDFPVFNIADCYVNVGCFFLIVYILFSKDVKK